MAGELNVGDHVRWHRPADQVVPALLVDGSVGVVAGRSPLSHQVMVDFEVTGRCKVAARDLTVICPVDLTRPEEVEAWLDA